MKEERGKMKEKRGEMKEKRGESFFHSSFLSALSSLLFPLF
jgi:hypothetical protein